MKLFIKKILKRTFERKNLYVSSILLYFLLHFSFKQLYALDPLDPNLFYQTPNTPFVLNLIKIRFPEKCEVRRLGTGSHWKVVPREGRAWMMILREWEGTPSDEESLKSFLKNLFPDSKNLTLPQFQGLKTIGAERKEIVSGTPLTVRYFLLEKNGRIVSIYFAFDSENKTVSLFFQDPNRFLIPSDSF
ncbi:hypothetical protein LEP1GSC060_1364 [Leptospira weilii serovar Ranarum str. ICFT]|uniref:Acyltransferase n=1 Tax=Leptospira weilii serovar Ranarum str. ICFT TaxID=1218598 RepID=N1WD50_9LEPT|nr:hypothetical protein [Leptospira weilii]EMY78186.1 hypothetical protein LEP1GSC060_1364 [Leptospira weilii serovar Ranarum str. ICFT]